MGCNFGPLALTGQGLNVFHAGLYFELAPGHFLVFRYYSVIWVDLKPAHAHNLLVDHESQQIGNVAFVGLPGKIPPINILSVLEYASKLGHICLTYYFDFDIFLLLQGAVRPVVH